MISVLIPLFNQSGHLPNLLNSISRQTYDNYEIIVVNDGSTDRPEKIIDQYKRIFAHKLICLEEENRGAAAARNYGASRSKGEYLIFCDADTVMQPQMLGEMLAALKQNPAASFCYSSFIWGGKKFVLWPYDAEKLRQMPYINTTSLVRREHFPGFDPALKRFQDWDLWLTMLEQGHTGVWINQILYKINPTGNQSMSRWLPSITYKLLPFLPAVKKYNRAMQIIKTKHNLK